MSSDRLEVFAGVSVFLGNWVSHQRQNYKSGHLSPERIAALAGLPGWDWGPLKRGPQRDEERDLRIKELCDNGLSLQQIADKVNLSRQRVHQIIQRVK